MVPNPIFCLFLAYFVVFLWFMEYWIFISIVDISANLKIIDIDETILKNIEIDIAKEVLENIDIDEEILENIEMEEVLGISTTEQNAQPVLELHYT